uniref:F-box domain-containing protein n=1 Tax=Romanomermis culicivorax TaxID=13658 RepID=A0A915IW98_ROMCU
MLLNHIICVHLTFTILKTSWDLKELVRFFCLMNLLTALVTCCIMILIYVATGAEDFYFKDRLAIRGVTGYDAAVLVAAVQSMPDTAIFTLPFGRFKNSHVPFTWIIVALILWLLNLLNLIHVLMFAVGFYISWCYLRFYQKHSNGSVGDSSACFGFHLFFPSVLQPFVEHTGKLTYQILIKLKICKPVIRSFDVKQLQSVVTTTPMIVDSADRERRKGATFIVISSPMRSQQEERLEDAEACVRRHYCTVKSPPDGRLIMIKPKLLDLPDDIFAIIFRSFTVTEALRFEIASKRCRALIKNFYWNRLPITLDLIDFLRQSPTINISNTYKFDCAAAALIKRVSKTVKHLSLCRFGSHEYSLRLGLEGAVIEYCHKLHTLELNNRLLERQWLIEVSQAIPNLKCLSMCRVYIKRYGQLDDTFLSILLQNWRNLEVLRLRDNCGVHLTCSSHFPPTLTALDVQGCRISILHLKNSFVVCPQLDSLSTMFNYNLESLEEFFPRLRQLSVDWSLCSNDGFIDNGRKIRDEILCSVLSRCFSLRSVTICGQLLNDRLMNVISDELVNLTEISFPGYSDQELYVRPFRSLSILGKSANIRKISLVNSNLASVFLPLCHKFTNLIVVDVSNSIKERKISDAEWLKVKSETLEELIMQNFMVANVDNDRRRYIAHKIYSLVRVGCPRFRRI